MNTNLLNAVNALKAEHGADVLDNHGALERLFETAREEPRAQIKTLITACVRDFHKELQNAAETERAACKERLAQKLHNDEGLDLTLCKNTLDLIEAALFGVGAPVCVHCGAELKAHWKACPECGTAVQGAGRVEAVTRPAQKRSAQKGMAKKLKAKAKDKPADSGENLDMPFLMPIEDVFTISGRGTVVTGKVERGKVKLNEAVEIVGISPTRKTIITGIEMFNKLIDEAWAGDNIGMLLDGVDKKEVERGQVLARPGSIFPHSMFEAEIYCLFPHEGGREKPFFEGYRPQFYIRTTDVSGTVTIIDGKEMVMPGDTAGIMVELIVPMPLETGMHFAIREGGKTVAKGMVTGIIEQEDE